MSTRHSDFEPKGGEKAALGFIDRMKLF